jgi:TorA maturation chaperone TorD
MVPQMSSGLYTDRRNQEEIEKAIGLSDLCKLLSLLLFLPTPEVTKDVFNGLLRNDVVAILRELPFEAGVRKNCQAAFEHIGAETSVAEEQLSELRKEYTRLFSHPVAPVIALFESLYRYDPAVDGADKPMYFINPIAMDTERRCRAAGLKLAEGTNIPGDHMGLELDLVAHLFLMKARALIGEEPDAVIRSDEQLESFALDHLSKWAVSFFSDVSALSKHALYSAIGLLGVTAMRYVIAVTAIPENSEKR